MKVLLIHQKINYDNMEPIGLLCVGTIRVRDLTYYLTVYYLCHILYFNFMRKKTPFHFMKNISSS